MWETFESECSPSFYQAPVWLASASIQYWFRRVTSLNIRQLWSLQKIWHTVVICYFCPRRCIHRDWLLFWPSRCSIGCLFSCLGPLFNGHPKSVYVCVSPARDASETVEVIIIKVCMVTASDMVMHHMLIILTLTFFQCLTDLNHENNKCLIISETVQAIPIKFAVEIVRLKVLYNLFSVRWPCSLGKVTTASQAWQMLNFYYNRAG